jgi:hypothetical protein
MRSTKLEMLIPLQEEEYVPTLKLQLSGQEGELTIPVSHLHHKVELSHLVKGLEENINGVIGHGNFAPKIVECTGLVDHVRLDLTDIALVNKPELKTNFKSVELDSDYIHVKFSFSSVRMRNQYAHVYVSDDRKYVTVYHEHTGMGLPTMRGCR